MPQLNTTTWPTIITSMLLIMQLKLLNTNYHLSSSQKINTQNYNSPWQSKWMKIYLPHSSPQQF